MEALLRDGEAALAELDAAFAEDPLMFVHVLAYWFFARSKTASERCNLLHLSVLR